MTAQSLISQVPVGRTINISRLLIDTLSDGSGIKESLKALKFEYSSLTVIDQWAVL
jgi:hypothetical protein